MGCLKLSYYQTYSNRKVLYSDCVLEPKSAQMWLSVDPMSDKYPSMSPYNYCANNPVKLIDPNGMEIDEAATKKDPPKLGHPSRDTFFDPQDDSQKNTEVKPPFVNTQSSKQSGTTAQSGSKTTSPSQQKSSQNNTSNNKESFKFPKLNIPKNISNQTQNVLE